MAKQKKSAKSKAPARKKTVAKKAPAPKPKAKAKVKAKVLRKPAPKKPAAKPARAPEKPKQQPKTLTPKQFAAKLRADKKDAKAREKAALKAGKQAQPAVAVAVDAKTKTRQRLTAKEKALVREFERKELSPLEAEARRSRLKNLIMLGKERGYLTYAEVNDHLPDDMMDAEQIENIISMINDMGLNVYDEAPDAETLLMSDATPAATDEDVVEEAEAALTTVDSEFGRTTDPVRMYMREMGSVELLTREGEIEIAKRIEDGLKHMIQAISACPTTIAEILALADRIEKDEIRVDDVVDGLVDPTADELAAEAADEEEEDADDEAIEEEEMSEEEQAAVQTADLLRLKEEALKRFAVIRNLYNKMLRALAKDGPRGKAYLQARDQISNELTNIRFGAKQVESLCDSLRKMVERVRSHERSIMDLCINKSKMPRQHFIKEFPGKESNMR